MKRVIIVNPHSAGGGTGKSWKGVAPMFRDSFGDPPVEFTDGPGAAVEIVRSFLKKGYEHIIVVGGDGTVNEAVNGFFDKDRPVKKSAVLSFVMKGTGCDYAKTFGAPSEPRKAIEGILNNPVRSVDLGRIECSDQDGKTSVRYFNNIASFGMGGEVARSINGMNNRKRIAGRALFYLVSVYMSLTCGVRSGAVRMERAPLIARRFRNISIAIGRYQGGGMLVAPDAAPDDGLFDVITIGDYGFLSLLTLTSDIYRGTHIRRPRVTVERCSELFAQCDRKVLIDVDGEAFGMLPARFTLLRSALKIKV